MRIILSPDLEKQFRKLRVKDEQLAKKTQKQLKLFTQNPKHPSLRIHKLSGGLKNSWSLSITEKIRMIYSIEDDTAIFSDLGAHDEVYRK